MKNLNGILCSLFTISPNAELFKSFNLELNNYGSNKDYINMNSFEFKQLTVLINQNYIRQFAFDVSSLLLEKNNVFFKSNETLKVVNVFPGLERLLDDKEGSNYPLVSLSNKEIVLKKYLKKFKYNYFRYFSKPSGSESKTTSKELNFLALENLLLISGI
jgi:hypothetical protein